MSRTPKIAIVGGGPAGLTLARILNVRGIPSVVYEAELHALARAQGGTLDLHPDTGQHALRLAGLEHAFDAIARYKDEATQVYDQQGRLFFRDAEEASGERPEVDRTLLRQMLIDSLPEGVIRWGAKVHAVREGSDGRMIVHHGDAASAPFDLVVGADGAWSKVRPLLSDATPSYEGVSFAEITIDAVDARYKNIASLLPHGTLFAFGVNQALIAQRNAASRVRIYAALRVPETWLQAELASLDREARHALIRDLFADWAPQLRDLLGANEGDVIARPLYALPIGHRWSSRPGVTLVGDAAHLISPFAGEGVNMAMADAADLAIVISGVADLRSGVRAYEERMFMRAAETAQWSADGLREQISSQGAERAAKMFAMRAGTAREL